MCDRCAQMIETLRQIRAACDGAGTSRIETIRLMAERALLQAAEERRQKVGSA